jgi:hypothetical protein
VADEYPGLFKLNADKSKLAVNLGKKLQIVDLITTQSHYISFAERVIDTATFSPDNTKLFIVLESTKPEEAEAVFFVVYNLTNCTNETIYEEAHHSGGFSEALWREDGKIVLKNLMPGDENYAFDQYDAYIFDVNTHELRHLEVISPTLSSRGKYLTIVKQSVSHACSEMENNSPGLFSVIDPIKGTTVGTIGSSSELVRILAFSEDETMVLFGVRKPLSKYEECGQEIQGEIYYAQNIKTGVKTKVSDITKLLAEWKTNYVGAAIEYGEVGIEVLNMNDVPLFTSTSSLYIVGQYYQ